VTSPAELPASRDPETGDVFVPPRQYAIDGSLRVCEPCVLSAEGVLLSWTTHAGDHFGLLDLAENVRIQALLDSGPHEVGTRYVGNTDTEGKVRYRRG
jgi:uncharacterized OB-fold protein